MTSIEIIALSVSGITAFFAALGGFFLWRNGTPQVASDAITAYQARVDQLKQDVEEWKNRVQVCERLHRENLTEVGKLKGTIQTLEINLQNRNPEMIEFMKLVSQTSIDAQKYMQNSHAILEGVKEFFDNMKSGKYAIVALSKPNA